MRGFTLTEMIIVIVILSILGLGSSRFIAFSARSMVDTAERQLLSSSANIALEKVLRGVRDALPNSVRVFDGGVNSHCIEYVPILFSSRYLSLPVITSGRVFEAIRFEQGSGCTAGLCGGLPHQPAGYL